MKNSKKLSIAQLALELTKKNLVKSRSSKKSTNDYLVEILTKDVKKTRIELVNEITIKRLLDNHDLTEDKLYKGLEEGNQEIIELFTKVNKTSKNGLDSSIAKGKSGSCFINSQYGSTHELIQNQDKTFSIIEKK